MKQFLFYKIILIFFKILEKKNIKILFLIDTCFECDSQTPIFRTLKEKNGKNRCLCMDSYFEVSEFEI